MSGIQQDYNHKHTIVMLMDDSTKPSTALFNYTDILEVYLFNGLGLYGEVVKNLIGSKRISLMVVFTDLQSMIGILSFLYKLEHTEKQLHTKEFEKSPIWDNDGVNSIACTHPLPVDLSIVMQSEILKQDPTSAESIMYQQLLRLVALLHGGIFAVIEDITGLCQQRSEITKIITSLKGHPEPNPIYKTESTDALHLVIPKGWDSWNKIVLLSKSIYYDPDSSDFALFTDKTNMQKITSTYINCLNQNSVIELQKLIKSNYKTPNVKSHGSNSKSLTYQNLVTAVSNT